MAHIYPSGISDILFKRRLTGILVGFFQIVEILHFGIVDKRRYTVMQYIGQCRLFGAYVNFLGTCICSWLL